MAFSSFRSASARPADPQPGGAPEWLQGLSQEERAAIGWGGGASPSDEDRPAAEAGGGFDEHELFFWVRQPASTLRKFEQFAAALPLPLPLSLLR